MRTLLAALLLALPQSLLAADLRPSKETAELKKGDVADEDEYSHVRITLEMLGLLMLRMSNSDRKKQCLFFSRFLSRLQNGY